MLTNEEFDAVYQQLLESLIYTDDPALESAIGKFHKRFNLQQAVGDVKVVDAGNAELNIYVEARDLTDDVCITESTDS